MNTSPLTLNGRTTADIAILPERQRANLKSSLRPKLYSSMTFSEGTAQSGSRPKLSSSLSYSGRPTLPKRPSYRRQASRESPGWYNTEGGMTLDDFAKRLDTTLSRIEQYGTRSAQSVVMALMTPTPIALFIFNPVSLLIWLVVAIWWLSR